MEPPSFWYKASHVCVTRCQRHWGKAQQRGLQGYYCRASKKQSRRPLLAPSTPPPYVEEWTWTFVHCHLMGEQSPDSLSCSWHSTYSNTTQGNYRSKIDEEWEIYPFCSLSLSEKKWFHPDYCGKWEGCTCACAFWWLVLGGLFACFLREVWCTFFPHRNILIYYSAVDQASSWTCP